MALGKNPLGTKTSKSIFTKTEISESQQVTPQTQKPQESRLKNQESRILKENEKEKVNLRLPIELNDWLDDLVKQGKRRHGRKIPKEVWVQVALEFFRDLPIDWEEVESVENLEELLQIQESRLKNQDS